MTTQQTPQKRRITFIPPDPKLTERDIRKKHLRVAPYCRVSTDSEEQLNSYNAQIAYYTEKIAAMPEWTMVRLYADEGITGTSMKRRKEFLKIWKSTSTSQTKCVILRKMPPVWSVQQMINILFVCHGNICRSPMAEFVMKDLVKKTGLESRFHIESAATSTEEIGSPVYPPARRKLTEHGISCVGKTARQLRNEDYDQYDLLIGMDRANLRNMHRICGGDFDGKMHLLLEFTDRPGDVADPWYTDDFETTWQDILAGCDQLMKWIISQYQIGENLK